MGELPEQGGDQQRRGAAGVEQRPERAEDVRVAPAERAPPLGRQGLGQADRDPQGVGRGERRRDQERRARAESGRQPADRRAEDEAEPERRPHQAEGRAPLLRRGDVGEHRIGGPEGGAGDARDQPPDEQPGERRRRRHQQIIEREGDRRKEQDRPPPEAVAEIAEHRPGEELSAGIADQHVAGDPGRLGKADLAEMDDEVRQHRQDDSEADRIDAAGR